MPYSSIHGGMEFDTRVAQVLSIGSQLVYGSVGNNAGNQIFAEANVRRVTIPSVILSSLPHYPGVQFQDVSDEWLSASLDQLEKIGVIEQLSYVTVGYLVRKSQADVIASHLERWFKRWPHLQLLLDPTIGDYDVGVYTNPGILEAHRDVLLPYATGMVPNRFELELLSGRQAHDSAESETAARTLFAGRLEWIIVTSSNQDGTLPDAALPDAALTDAALQDSARARVEDCVVTRDGPATVLSHDMVRTTAKGAGDQFLSKLTLALLRGKTLLEASAIAQGNVADGLSHSVVAPPETSSAAD